MDENKQKEEKTMPKHASGVATGALVTGITGTVLAGGEILKDVLKDRREHGGGCADDRYVTRPEVGLIRENNALLSENATLRAEKYADNKIACAVEKLEAKIERLECKVDKTADFLNNKITSGYEDLAAKFGDLKTGLVMECEKRACGDKELLTFIEGNYIKADKVLDVKHINHGISCPGMKRDDKCRENDLLELLKQLNLTGTLTLGTTTTAAA